MDRWPHFSYTCYKFCEMWTIFLLFGLSCQSVLSANYEFLPEDPDIFSDCRNPPGPPGATNIKGLFSLDELELSLIGDMVHIEGNLTTVWDIQPTDRIYAAARVMHWNRGVWQSTVFDLHTKDLCKILYDKAQYWYTAWVRHVTNVDEVRSKCLYLKDGLKIIHEPFDLKMVYENIQGVKLYGRYKIVIIMEAFEEHKNIKRPTTVCVEIIGDVNRI
ncbi:uncharacterized protein LOC116805064 [Drosophila grimshawi]|uniref:uncharacterized protein LOC116805064 n=1 Tax=Drosophila grimshawi TaxID=7222 RepID=UPI000C871492|nr:uncharacterized protein LOC116805064 [Drosophila grimshawi]